MRVSEPATWQDRAACRDMKPEVFFPDAPEDNPTNNHPVMQAYEEARQICMRCPVREECLTYAMTCSIMEDVIGEPDGMWGGAAPYERKKYRKVFHATGTIPWDLLVKPPKPTHCPLGHILTPGHGSYCGVCVRRKARLAREGRG